MFNLKDKDVSLSNAFAAVLWLIGAALTITNMFVEPPLGSLGLLIAGWGGVLTIRGYVCSGVAAVAAREENAYELGRDSVRSLR